jgi:hypothetical protein
LGGGSDTLTGGEGADLFGLSHETAAEGAARIIDFDPETDQLVVYYDPGLHPDPELSFDADPDTETLLVLLDGLPVATIEGHLSVPPAAIRLEADPPLAA